MSPAHWRTDGEWIFKSRHKLPKEEEEKQWNGERNLERTWKNATKFAKDLVKTNVRNDSKTGKASKAEGW